MMPALIRAIFTLFLALAPILAGQDIVETARALAIKVAAHVPAGASVRVTARNASSLNTSEVVAAQAALERALRRRTPRQAPVVEVRLTFSENRREFLLVAETVFESGRAVEIVRYVRETAVPRTLPAIEKRFLFEQAAAILDVALMGERMLVLDAAKLTLMERQEGRWEPAGSFAIDIPPVRDPRGRLQVSGDIVEVFVPGATCRGNTSLQLGLKCEPAAEAFALGGEQVRFTPGRNTLEWIGSPPVYSLARAGSGSKSVGLAAETDGRSRLYDSERRPAGVIEGWGSDLATICGGRVLATARDSHQVKAYAPAELRMVEATEPIDLPGPVTAMWPMAGGAVAIVLNQVSGRYAAYGLSVDCGH